jgi:hypothetical protein
MTMTIYGNVPHSNAEINITPKAAELANIGFNPAADEKILALKTLAAAFHTLCDEIQHDDPNATELAKREAAVARTSMQTAAMFAVQARARSFNTGSN